MEGCVIWTVLLQAADPAREVGLINSQILDYIQLLLVLAGILLVAFVAMRYGLPRLAGIPLHQSGPIEAIARYPLEPRKHLYLVKAGAVYLLLASTDGRIEKIDRLSAEEIEPYLGNLDQQEKPAPSAFLQLLRGGRK